MHTMSNSTTTINTPVVTRDPRFQAGRSLVQKGLASEGAIEIFSTLVEEATAKYGESSIETAPAYYEYGNALLRAAQAAEAVEDDDDDHKTTVTVDEGTDSKPVSTPTAARLAAAAAAEQRQKQQQQQPANVRQELGSGEDAGSKSTTSTPENGGENLEQGQGDCKPAAVSSSCTPEEEQGDTEKENSEIGESNEGDNAEVEQDEEGNDLTLSLEMMENAFSILEEYKSTSSSGTTAVDANHKDYREWVDEQLPRILLGLGDVLSTMNRHADAADAYSRALELRLSAVVTSNSGGGDDTVNDKESSSTTTLTLSHLQARRKIVEATVLIAEELLACDPDKDVIATETGSLIVAAAERVEYARGYYDKARDALQEAVYLMGTLAAKGINLGSEKEDICFIATMVVGVGTQLAELDEEAQATVAAGEPAPKRRKT
jgi:tetratricopeptide (TPR) repeat protein